MIQPSCSFVLMIWRSMTTKNMYKMRMSTLFIILKYGSLQNIRWEWLNKLEDPHMEYYSVGKEMAVEPWRKHGVEVDRALGKVCSARMGTQVPSLDLAEKLSGICLLTPNRGHPRSSKHRRIFAEAPYQCKGEIHHKIQSSFYITSNAVLKHCFFMELLVHLAILLSACCVLGQCSRHQANSCAQKPKASWPHRVGILETYKGKKGKEKNKQVCIIPSGERVGENPDMQERRAQHS